MSKSDISLPLSIELDIENILTLAHAAFWLLVVFWSIAVILFVFHLIDGRRKDRMSAFERAMKERADRHFGGV